MNRPKAKLMTTNLHYTLASNSVCREGKLFFKQLPDSAIISLYVIMLMCKKMGRERLTSDLEEQAMKISKACKFNTEMC